MEAVSYYRGLVYYFKKCLINDEEGLAKIQNMDLVNPHPMEYVHLFIIFMMSLSDGLMGWD